MENWPLNLFLPESGIDCKNYLEKGSSICLKNIVVKLFVINNQVCCIVILKGQAWKGSGWVLSIFLCDS